jgi:hypothetical protein
MVGFYTAHIRTKPTLEWPGLSPPFTSVVAKSPTGHAIEKILKSPMDIQHLSRHSVETPSHIGGHTPDRSAHWPVRRS